MLLLGASGGLLGYVGYALVIDPWILMVIGSTVLALGAVCFSQLFAYVRETFRAAENGEDDLSPAFLMSVVRVCFSFAWTVGPAIGAAMAATFGFRGVFLGAALLYLVFFAGVVRFVRFCPHPPQAAEARPPIWRVLARGDIAAVFIAFLLFFAAHAMNMLNLPLMITQALGGTERHVGIVFGVGPLAEIPLMLWFGLLAARGHQLALIRIGAVASLAYFILLGFVGAPWHIYPLQILSGAAFAILTNVAILFYQDLLPRQTGLATALFGNAMHIGNLAGYLCFGALVGAVGQQRISVLAAALSTIPVIILVLYRGRPGREAVPAASS
jgi:SET family sugar efflux transporter-like MFS transporter